MVELIIACLALGVAIAAYRRQRVNVVVQTAHCRSCGELTARWEMTSHGIICDKCLIRLTREGRVLRKRFEQFLASSREAERVRRAREGREWRERQIPPEALYEEE